VVDWNIKTDPAPRHKQSWGGHGKRKKKEKTKGSEVETLPHKGQKGRRLQGGQLTLTRLYKEGKGTRKSNHIYKRRKSPRIQHPTTQERQNSEEKVFLRKMVGRRIGTVAERG